MKDLLNNIGVVQLLVPQDVAGADTKSDILDLQGFGSAVVAVQVGTLTGVDGSNYLTPSLQESDTTNDADFTTVAAGDLIDSELARIDSATEDAVVQCVGYRGSKRYIRASLDFTGSGITVSPVAVLGIAGHPASGPVTAPAAVAAVAGS